MGHVDSVATVVSITPEGQDHMVKVQVPENLLKYCIDKGSITIDGISLTIANMEDDILEFWITPHTFQRTNLQFAKPGTLVNIEVDMLAKYVERIFAERFASS